MRKYDYNYNICDRFDVDVYTRQCQVLEKRIPGIIKTRYLHDVDDSQYQYYDIGGKEAVVVNSDCVGAVYVMSDVNLELYF